MAVVADALPQLSKSKLRKILKDEEKTARAAHLLYVSDQEAGIERRKKGKNFEYYFNGQLIKDDEELLRIKHLVFTPAWEKVWICK